MNHWLKAVCVVLTLTVMASAARVGWSEDPAKPLPAHVVEKIAAAIPAKAQVKPTGPRKVLVFTLTRGYRHSSIPWGAQAFALLGKKTGAYEPVVSDDVAMFEPETLAQFDAVVLMNCTGNLFGPNPSERAKMDLEQLEAARKREQELRNSLLDFVSKGKGLVGIHAATDCFYEWGEFGRMMGGYFNGHPWWYSTDADGKPSAPSVTLRVEERDHPVCEAFEQPEFVLHDEIYQFRAPYSREALRVLLSINLAKSNADHPRIKGSLRRPDGDYAVSWIREYEKGRVFYCSLGHGEAIYTNPTVLKHYLDGVQYALGDLKADATPSAKLGPDADKPMTLDAAFKQLPTYSFRLSFSRKPLSVVADHVRDSKNDPKARAALANRLAALLATDATPDCKDFVFRQLKRIGFAEQVPAIAKHLTNPRHSHMARYALERMKAPEAGKALSDALGALMNRKSITAAEKMIADNTEDPKKLEKALEIYRKDLLAMQVGLINSLGDRREMAAVGQLANLITDNNRSEPLRIAGASTLGEIGGPEAIGALARVKSGKTSAALHFALADAYLKLADRMRATGGKGEATLMYMELFASNEPLVPIRIAALKGLARGKQEQALEMIKVGLFDPNPMIQTAAARFSHFVRGETPTFVLAGTLPALSATARTALVTALGERGRKGIIPALFWATRDGNANVRMAAARSIGQVGDETSAVLLAQMAASSEGAEQAVARVALDQLGGKKVHDTMIRELQSVDPDVAVEVIRSLGARKAPEAMDSLLKHAADSTVAVRKEAFKTISMLAGENHISAILTLLTQMKGNKARSAAETTLVTVLGRTDGADRQAAPVIAALPDADVAARGSLLRVLGRIGGAKALAAVQAEMDSKDEKVRDAAIRSLTAWPGAEAADALLALGRGGASKKLHALLALQGYIRLAGLPDVRPETETLAMYRTALELASRDEEKRLILAGLGTLTDPAAMKLALTHLDNPALKEEVVAAVIKVADAVEGIYGPASVPTLQKALAATENEELRKKVTESIANREQYTGHITAWEAAGPYTKSWDPALLRDAKEPSLYDEVLPPEKPGAPGVKWERIATPSDPARPWRIHVWKVYWGRPERYRKSCAFIRTQVWSPKAQTAVLELGSEQSLKVWLNGEQIHANEIENHRPFEPGDDKVEVKLVKGWNKLMLKLPKFRGGWSACARFTTADETPLEGVRAAHVGP